MKNLLLLLSLTVVFLAACNNTKRKTNEKNIIVNNKVIEKEHIPTEFIDTAFITEDNVWLRKKATDGDVIAKIDNKSKVFIIRRGVKDTIRGNTDYWYQVEYQGVTGWVFGSQTSLSIAKLVTFDKVINLFMKAYNHKNVTKLDEYVHPQYGVSFGFLNCDPNSVNPKYTDVQSYPDFISFDTLQGFSNSFPEVKCNNPVNDATPEYIGNYKWSREGCYWNEISQGEIKLISTSNIYEFYFKAIESNWFLIRIEKIDCNQ